MDYREHAPALALTPWLDCLWERRGTGQPVRVLPDGCIDVIWIEGVGAQVVGPSTAAFVASPAAGAHVVGARLRPGAANTLLEGIEPEGLRDSRPSAEDALGGLGARLADSLAHARDPLEQLQSELLQQARRAPPPDPLVQAAVTQLRRPGAAVAPVAHAVGLSERQLRRRVAAAVGYGPKLLARVLRLQRALDAARSGHELAWAALEAGYVDQAHFSGDCRSLAGVPPARLLELR